MIALHCPNDDQLTSAKACELDCLAIFPNLQVCCTFQPVLSPSSCPLLFERPSVLGRVGVVGIEGAGKRKRKDGFEAKSTLSKITLSNVKTKLLSSDSKA